VVQNSQTGLVELWGGVECSVVRIGDSYRNQFEESGHLQNLSDLDAIASLGIRVLRYPVLWETVAPDQPDGCDWTLADAGFDRLRSLGIRPIAGLLHHGSGPFYTSMLDKDFPRLLAAHAERVAERYPWVEMFTPVNEPLTTARFSGLYGHWYPHGRDLPTFLRCLVNECLATLFSVQAIRKVNPRAQLIQTEDLGKTFSTPHMSYQAEYENERRWLSLDLLCGRVVPSHPWHETLLHYGIGEWELDLLSSGEATPDIIGINYYATSERYLDEALQNYPVCFHGENGGDPLSPDPRKDRYADVEALRVDLPEAELGAKARVAEAWERYGQPVAITEAHHGSTRDEQVRWLAEVWTCVNELRKDGCDIRAMTIWSLMGAIDWNSLLTERNGFYEPGAFDIRGPKPRLTAIGRAAEQIARTGTLQHPVLDQPGWWRRDGRHYHPPARKAPALVKKPRSILIAGANGRLGRELVRNCHARGLDITCPDQGELDITDTAQVESAITRHKPWAVINAAGLGHDGAPRLEERVFEVNSLGAQNLAKVCSARELPLMTFSSDRVFDGTLERPYVESDEVSPTCFLGGSKADAERRIAQCYPRALIIRTSALLGAGHDAEQPKALRAAKLGSRAFVTATYLPHLVRAALDLLIDDESGIWHLSNQGAIPADELSALLLVGHPPVRESSAGLVVLGSERGLILPSLREALECHREQVTFVRLETPLSAGPQFN
jgi:dTDP-4-dehydrorhamnose reductase